MTNSNAIAVKVNEGAAIEEVSAEAVGGDAAEPVFIARAAVCVLRLPDSADSMFTTPEARRFADEVQEKIETALEADSRVSEVIHVRSSAVDNASTHSYWKIHDDQEKLTDSFDGYEGLRFNRVTVFRVRVPLKNQPRYRNMDDVPSDDYLVVWDGESAIVQWEQDSPRSTGSGGHVVLALLEEVVAATGYEVEVVACAPTCHHRFVHADFVSFSGEHDHDEFQINGSALIGSTVETPWGKRPSDIENLNHTYRALQGPLAVYGQARSLATFILFLEHRARGDSADVLAIAHQRASRSTIRHPRQWVRDTWALRGSRRESRELMSGLWLALVTIDSQRRVWRALERRLRESLRTARMPVLVSELDVDTAQIEAQDVSLLKDSVAELGARTEGRQLLLATGSGAVAALAGAALAALLTSK